MASLVVIVASMIETKLEWSQESREELNLDDKDLAEAKKGWKWAA